MQVTIETPATATFKLRANTLGANYSEKPRFSLNASEAILLIGSG